MKAELIIIPHACIHPDRINIYNEVNWSPSKPSRRDNSAIAADIRFMSESFKTSKRKHNGLFSKQAKRKAERAIDYLITTAVDKKHYERLSGKYVQFRVAFVTLTLPSTQINTDKEITEQCFNQFLTEIRKYHNVSRYVWRAEKQGNGNIHYHLLTDCFIPWYELKNRWNRIINKLGYVDRFQAKNGLRQPNSTDIHSLKKIKNVKKYVLKYLTKSSIDAEKLEPEEIEKQIVNCRLWSCSQSLSNLKGCDLIIDKEVGDELTKVIANSKCRSFSSAYFSVYYIDFESLRKNGSEKLLNYFLAYLKELFDYDYQLKISQLG